MVQFLDSAVLIIWDKYLTLAPNTHCLILQESNFTDKWQCNSSILFPGWQYTRLKLIDAHRNMINSTRLSTNIIWIFEWIIRNNVVACLQTSQPVQKLTTQTWKWSLWTEINLKKVYCCDIDLPSISRYDLHNISFKSSLVCTCQKCVTNLKYSKL